MFFSEVSQAVLARPGKCSLKAVTTKTGVESYDIRKNRREFMMQQVAFKQGKYTGFLGTFAKLRKATVSFVMSVRLSVRMGKLGCYWTDFNEI